MIIQEPQTQNPPVSSKRPSVVIVDDQPETLSSLRRLLGGEPYSLATFSSAEEALRWMAVNPVDVFIADERMPGMRGSDLLALVRDRSPETMRVILTGHPGSATVAYGLSCGIDRLISKPWNNDALKLTILQLIEGRELKKRYPGGSSEPEDGPVPSGFDDRTPTPLHCVGSGGIILWANRAELELLGFPRPEYVGRSITEFHDDDFAPGDLLARLSRKEAVRRFPARLRCRNGTIRNVLFDADGVWEGGKFVHAWVSTREEPAPDGAVHDLRDINTDFLREIAGRKRAEDTARLSEMRFRLLVEGV
ncbi:MAG: response regulator [Planctomycetes bacterium]|nr:response regulator [Planctomycetota bacterium]